MFAAARSVLKSFLNLLDKDIEPIYAEDRIGDIKHSLADITQARSWLRYEPEINLKEGLKRVAATVAT